MKTYKVLNYTAVSPTPNGLVRTFATIEETKVSFFMRSKKTIEVFRYGGFLWRYKESGYGAPNQIQHILLSYEAYNDKPIRF